MADQERCNALYFRPAFQILAVCNRWPHETGLHRSALADDGHGTLVGFEWGRPDRSLQQAEEAVGA